ncbi:HAD family hydrolase [Curtobacterium sp. MCLR17_040]|nr:HAD family hydrolase [Curtobacterium sp. MCLR17_040]
MPAVADTCCSSCPRPSVLRSSVPSVPNGSSPSPSRRPGPVSVSRDRHRSLERHSERPLDGVDALFLDRDGVLVVDHGHVGSLDRTELVPDAIEAAARAWRDGVPVVVVTNQSGIARGWYDWSGFDTVNGHIRRAMQSHGADVDVMVGSARLPGDPDPWRKPGPGMVLAAAAAFGIRLAGSWIVGDRPSDLACGRAAGLAGGVLVGDLHATGVTPAAGITTAATMIGATAGRRDPAR